MDGNEDGVLASNKDVFAVCDRTGLRKGARSMLNTEDTNVTGESFTKIQRITTRKK